LNGKVIYQFIRNLGKIVQKEGYKKIIEDFVERVKKNLIKL
jgi:hypothetical protein